MRRAAARGFTLVEMVVAIAITGIILVFVTMFLSAPVDAYAAHGRRALLVADATTAWPRIEADLRAALPNSVRVRRNGGFVVLEMLETRGYARYAAPPNTASFLVAGTVNGVFGSYAPGAVINGVHLAVNNIGQQAYTQTTSMSPAVNITLAANGTPGEATVQMAAPQAINTNSPRNRVYLVTVPITYLCDEGQGTMRRYAGYGIAASQVSRDTPAELAGATSSELVARGLTTCNFDAPLQANRPQNVSVRLTTTRSNESVTLLHTAALENLP